MKTTKINKKSLAVFSVVAGLSIICGISSVIKGISDLPQKNEQKSSEKSFSQFIKNGNKFKAPKNEYIAQIEITGVITDQGDTYNQEWIMDTISQLKEDKNNRGIILCIDSPGGGVYEADETYLALMKYKKDTGRPIYSYFKNLAASGGYYIACSSDYIMANRNSLVGSIGVICGQFVDVSEFLEKHGIRMTTIHSGRNKIMGEINEPLTKEQRDIMQSICDEGYDQFVQIVSDARSLEKSRVIEIADGRIYTAKQAQENRLIDSTGSLEDLKDAMKRREFDFADYEVVDYSYVKAENLYSMIMGAADRIGRNAMGISIFPNSAEKLLESKVKFPAYYCDMLE